MPNGVADLLIRMRQYIACSKTFGVKHHKQQRTLAPFGDLESHAPQISPTA